ncbi:MAG: hypothetical protein U0797_06190 [Gemmataceae bacterium]
MALFGFMAQAAFKGGPDGETWFCPGGPWTRPYVVPDAGTQERLYRRQLWMVRLLFAFIVIGQPLVFALLPAVTQDAYGFLGYLAVVVLSFWAVSYLVFRGELKTLRRASTRLTPGMISRDLAIRCPTGVIVFGLLTCVAFVACGVWMALTDRNVVMGWVCVVVFIPWPAVGTRLGLLKIATLPGGSDQGSHAP